MRDNRLTAEDEQLLLMERPKADLFDWEVTVIHVGTLRSLLQEIQLAWRVRSAMGMNEWPADADLKRMEAQQDEMRREYESDVRQERGES